MTAPDEWDTQADTVELAIPKLRQARYHPHASLGFTQLSKPQVSAMARHLDKQVGAFRNQPHIAAHATSQPAEPVPKSVQP
ncbi:hypothetical protein ABT255_60145 [Streptomyces mirabilis]